MGVGKVKNYHKDPQKLPERMSILRLCFTSIKYMIVSGKHQVYIAANRDRATRTAKMLHLKYLP